MVNIKNAKEKHLWMAADSNSTSRPFVLSSTKTLRRSQRLAGERWWARVCVAGRNGVVDVDQDTRVRRLISTRERNQIGRRLAAASSYVELCAGKVELGAACALSGVQTNVLVAHQVLSGGDAAWDLDVVV